MADSNPATSGTPQSPKNPERWNAIASLITAVVSGLTFLLGFIGLPAAGVDSPAGSPATVTATATVTTTATAGTPGTPRGTGGVDDQPPPSSEPSVRWSGSLLVRNYFWLDPNPPEAGVGAGDLTLGELNGGKDAQFKYVAPVPKGKSPNKAECMTLAKTQTQGAPRLAVGDSACLLSEAGRTALFTVKSIDPSIGVRVDVRVWEK